MRIIFHPLKNTYHGFLDSLFFIINLFIVVSMVLEMNLVYHLLIGRKELFCLCCRRWRSIGRKCCFWRLLGNDLVWISDVRIWGTFMQSVVRVFQILTVLSSLPVARISGFFRKSTFITSSWCPAYTLWAIESSVDHNLAVLSADPLRKKYPDLLKLTDHIVFKWPRYSANKHFCLKHQSLIILSVPAEIK